jgi:hypothetical protein
LKSRLNNLEAARQSMLQERSRYISNIQNGTYLMWKEGLDQLEQFIALNLDWGTKLINEFNTKGDSARKHLFFALIKNQSRACLMSEEILHLLKGGFADAAFARWRSLYEIAVTASFIGLRGESCAEAYLDHGIVDELKCHQLDHEVQAARGAKPNSNAGLEALEAAFQEMLKKHGDSFKNPFGWAAATLGQKNPQFTDLEKNLGQDHMRAIYKRASHMIHAAANGISTSLGTQSFGPDAPMLRSPTHEGLGDPAIFCARSLSQISAVVTTLFPKAECLIEMHLFAELVSRIEKTFDRLAERNGGH